MSYVDENDTYMHRHTHGNRTLHVQSSVAVCMTMPICCSTKPLYTSC